MKDENKEKKFYVNDFIGEVDDVKIVLEKMNNINDMVEEDINKKQSYYFKNRWKYTYKPINENKIYTLEDFKPTGEKNNRKDLSNYELYAYKLERLTIPKILIQAYGLQSAMYWCELARMSMYKPVNDYGYFATSKYEINRDIGLSPKQQDKCCKTLIDLGVLETKTFQKEMRKFYKFNDDRALDLLFQLKFVTYKSIKFKKELLGEIK